jgi:anti-sigma regulatory factor (Ser/Thr protein kinase)
MTLVCPLEQILTLRFPSHTGQLKVVREKMRCAMQDMGYDEALVDPAVLAVNEACMNIMQHAYGEHDSGDIILEIGSEGDELVFRLTDFAEPVDVSKVSSRALDDIRPGGLGVYMMNQLMDEVRFLDAPEGVGNILEMRKSIVDQSRI